MESEYIDGFFSDTPYTFRDMFQSREHNIYGGTFMPLTALCEYSESRYEWKVRPLDKYTDTFEYNVPSLHIETNYVLNPCGQIVYNRQKELFNLERSRVDNGISVRILGQNERHRQEFRLRKAMENPDFLAIKEKFYDWFIAERVDEWQDWLYACCGAFEQIEKDGIGVIMEDFNHYMNENDKATVSYLKGIEYQIVAKSPRLLKDGFDACKTVTRQIARNPYCSKIPSIENQLEALRNRPLDLRYEIKWEGATIEDGYSIGDMIRSREAGGVIPFSHLWTWLYRLKTILVDWFLKRLQKSCKMRIRMPMNDSKFFLDVIQGKDGYYVFGDNIMYIDKGVRDIMDVGMSEIIQGFLRQGSDNSNLCWFIGFNDVTRQGSSGDPVTTLWNIEGDVGLDLIYREDPGLFEGEGKLKIPNVIGESNTFLGLGFPEGYPVQNVGFKINVDSAEKRKPHTFRLSGGKIANVATGIDYPRAVQTIISYGLHNIINLEWLYKRVDQRQQWLDSDFELFARIERYFREDDRLLNKAVDTIGEDVLKTLFPRLQK